MKTGNVEQHNKSANTDSDEESLDEEETGDKNDNEVQNISNNEVKDTSSINLDENQSKQSNTPVNT